MQRRKCFGTFEVGKKGHERKTTRDEASVGEKVPGSSPPHLRGGPAGKMLGQIQLLQGLAKDWRLPFPLPPPQLHREAQSKHFYLLPTD